jgi:hypothetical protein
MTEETQATIDAVITPDEARQLLNQEAQERVRQCSQAIDAVLEQYQCQLGTQSYLTADGRIAARLQIVSR